MLTNIIFVPNLSLVRSLLMPNLPAFERPAKKRCITPKGSVWIKNGIDRNLHNSSGDIASSRMRAESEGSPQEILTDRWEIGIWASLHRKVDQTGENCEKRHQVPSPTQSKICDHLDSKTAVFDPDTINL